MKKNMIIVFLVILGLCLSLYFYKYFNQPKTTKNNFTVSETTKNNFTVSETTKNLSNNFMGISFDYPDNLNIFSYHYTREPDDTISFFNDKNQGPFIEVTLNYEDFNSESYNGKFGECGEEPKELKPIIFSLFKQKAEALCMESYKVNDLASMVINGKTYYSYSIKSDISSSFPASLLGTPGIYSNRTDYFILPGDHYFIEFKFSGINEKIIKNVLFSVKPLRDEHSIYLDNIKPALEKW